LGNWLLVVLADGGFGWAHLVPGADTIVGLVKALPGRDVVAAVEARALEAVRSSQ